MYSLSDIIFQQSRQVYVFPRKRGLKSGTKSVYNFVCLSKAKISQDILWYFFEPIGWRGYFFNNKYNIFCIIFQSLAHSMSRPRATALHFCTAFHDFLRLTSRLFSRKLFYIWFRFMQGAISLNKIWYANIYLPFAFIKNSIWSDNFCIIESNLKCEYI